MNENETKEPAVPIAASSLPSGVGETKPLETYEDCVALISASPSSPALDALKAFFDKRIKKTSSDREKDDGAAVKRSLAASRTYKQHTIEGPSAAPASTANYFSK